MRLRHLLILLGVVLTAVGLIERGWRLLLVWAGCDFLILGVAYARGSHRLFGKRENGTLPLWSRVFFGPLLLYSTGVWHLLRTFTREQAFHAVNDQLVIGRRLRASELSAKFDNIVDLTAEFAEPSAIRRCAGYRCFPILDGSAPTPEALQAAVDGLRPGRTFVHCAQGHGRAALFALAMLLRAGTADNIDEGMRILSGARPGVRLSRAQRECIEAYARNLPRTK